MILEKFIYIYTYHCLFSKFLFNIIKIYNIIVSVFLKLIDFIETYFKINFYNYNYVFIILKKNHKTKYNQLKLILVRKRNITS